MPDLRDIELARVRIGGAVYLSPCPRSQALSELAGCELYLKLENLQMTGSFKERGALNKLLSLSDEERARGVIAASAGNHAQGLSFVARQRGVNATIVMPLGTPLIKVSRTRSFGAEVVLHGESYDDAAAEAERIADQRGLLRIHPFDDEAVIAGQGTIGLELLEQVPDLDAVVVPVGGGGLASGVALAIKESRPSVAVYGVEPSLVPSLTTALQSNAPVTLRAARTLADGIAVRRIAERTLSILRERVDQTVLVDEEEIAAAILALLEQEKTVAEGAAAAALAAVLKGSLPIAGKRVVVVLTGGNIDVNMLARVIDRGLVKSGRSMRLRVLIPDVPGSLADLLRCVADTQANVLQVDHDRLAARTAPGLADVQLVLETRGFEHIESIRSRLVEAGWVIAG